VNTRGASAEENFRELGRGRAFLKDERHPRIVCKRMGVVCCFRKRSYHQLGLHARALLYNIIPGISLLYNNGFPIIMGHKIHVILRVF
jgi:hypothetical protein